MVTVLLVTYNHEPYIRKALDSILEQKTNFKFIVRVLDDCSLDGSVDIIKSYRDRYPSIIDFSESMQNRGIVENKLSGLLNINTKYFATLEGDDYWCDKNKLQKQVNALEINSDCSFCGHNTIQKNNDGTSFIMYDSRQYDILEKYSFPIKYNKRRYLKVHPSSRLYRYSAIDFESLVFKETLCWDSCNYWYFLSKGNLFYINEAMSVYNFTGKGIYSGSNRQKRAQMAVKNIINIDAELEYKYYYIFSKLLYKYKNEMKLNLIECFLLKNLPFLSHKKWVFYLSRIH